MSNPVNNPTFSAAELAHEANNLMQHVVWALDCLSRHPERTDLIEVAFQTAQRVSGVFRATLDVAKADAGKSCVVEEEFCLAELLAFVQRMFKCVLERSKITLKIDCPSDILKLRGDAQHLQQVVINLVSNAVKFTRNRWGSSGGGIVVLRVYQVYPGAFLFTVEDNGPGMNAQTKSRLFEAFHQAAATASEGTGLGLSICSKLARIMGATMSVESELGSGSTFSILVPLTVAVPSQIAALKAAIEYSGRFASQVTAAA
jgi:signal transduction histidine kinase